MRQHHCSKRHPASNLMNATLSVPSNSYIAQAATHQPSYLDVLAELLDDALQLGDLLLPLLCRLAVQLAQPPRSRQLPLQESCEVHVVREAISGMQHILPDSC